MPIVDEKYVSPTWSNDSGTKINASEMQAITDTIEKNQNDKVAFSAQPDITDAQKQQARDNIAAAGRTDVEPLINQWDEQWRLGRWNQTSGNYELMTDRICSANYIPVKPSTQYYVHVPSGFLMVFYDSNFSRISQATLTGAGTFTTPSNTTYMNFTLGTGYGTTYNHDISINYPATYTGYYPANYSGVKNSLGKLGNAIIRNGWNQRVKNGNFVDTSAWGWTTSFSTFAVSGGVGTVTATASNAWNIALYQSDILTAGHKILAVFDIKTSAATRWRFRNPIVGTQNPIAANTWVHVAEIVTAGDAGFSIQAESIPVGGTMSMRNAMVFDLTDIFGAGNEPSVEQFRQLFPDDYYPYATPGFGDLLWTNESPTLPFGYQHLTIPALDNYTMYAVVAKLSISAYPESVFFFRTGHSGNAVFANTETAGLKTWQRTFTASGSDLLITDAKYSAAGATGADNNNGCIPLYIYGIK